MRSVASWTRKTMTGAVPDALAAERYGTSLHWYVINLDRSADRLAVIAQQLDALGLPWTRVTAVDGKRIRLPLPALDLARYLKCHGRYVLPSEIGCYLSHLRVMREFLDSPHAFAMVLEDDAEITPEVVELARSLIASDAPDDWDMVKFEAHRTNVAFPIRRLSGRHRLCALPYRPTGSAAYLVNRKAAQAYIDRLLPMVVPYDHAFDRGWALGLRVRSILPRPVRTVATATTVATPDQPFRKLKAFRKLPALWWRTRTETMRFVSALHGWLAPQRAFPWTPRKMPGRERLQSDTEKVLAGR
jgi:glycosyl transferase family 25